MITYGRPLLSIGSPSCLVWPTLPGLLPGWSSDLPRETSLARLARYHRPATEVVLQKNQRAYSRWAIVAAAVERPHAAVLSTLGASMLKVSVKPDLGALVSTCSSYHHEAEPPHRIRKRLTDDSVLRLRLCVSSAHGWPGPLVQRQPTSRQLGRGSRSQGASPSRPASVSTAHWL